MYVSIYTYVCFDLQLRTYGRRGFLTRHAGDGGIQAVLDVFLVSSICIYIYIYTYIYTYTYIPIYIYI